MWSRLIDKITSARFIVTISLVHTYCYIMWECVNLFKNKLISSETFLALLAGFSSAVILVIKSYFDRTDRITQTGGNSNEKVDA